MDEKQRKKAFFKLKKDILKCRLCKEKFGFTPHPVFWGKPNTKVVHISQAPSSTVHKTLKPFDDSSGKKLRSQWYKIPDELFYNPDFFYLTSIGHCYPGKKTGGDRVPPKSCAKRWLTKEIELVENDIYILIGKYSASFFFPKEDFTTLVFKDNYINGKKAYVLPHPSPSNIKWFQDNPTFLTTRLVQIQKELHKVLGLEK